MKNRKIGILGAAFGLILNACLGVAANALTISTNLNASAIDLVNHVLGEGIVATSAKKTGTVYSFSDGAGTFGIDSGIMLDTSGRASGANDADLAKLMDYSYGGHTSTLEFELVSTGSLLNFNYVFASREFDQPVKYNDVFGLFVSVNGSAYENIALIERNDGEEVPVTINNLRAGASGTEAPNSFTGYPVNGKQYSLFKGASVALNETVDGVSNVFTAFKEVSVGDVVKVKFAIADVSDAKYDSYVMIEASSLSFEAPGARPNYFTENLYNLEPETTYKITLGGVDYTVTTDANGETPIVTDDYDLFGHTIQITKTGLGQTAQTLKIAARPEPPAPVEGPDENYVLPDMLVVTETSITVVAEEGQQYRIDDNMTWRDADENGLVVFSGLTPNVPHTIYTRYAATENHPVSYSSEGTEIATLRSLDYTVQNYWGLHDGAAHAAEVFTEVGTIYYNADGSRTFSATKPEFTEVGKYPVYFLIQAEGYYSVYGVASVEIVGWEYDLKVTETGEAAEVKVKATARERIEAYYAGELNKVVDGVAMERVYETEETRTITVQTEAEDGEYEVVVVAEDGASERVMGSVSSGVLTFQTNKFGKYGLVIPLPEMVEGVDYTVAGWSGLYDGEEHGVVVTSEGEVSYAATLNGEYAPGVITYSEPGVYTTYYKVEKEGYVSAQGQATVEIIGWEYGLEVTEIKPVAGMVVTGEGQEVAFFYAGELNKMVEGEKVERVYEIEGAMAVEVTPAMTIEGERYYLKDGEYEILVLAEDGEMTQTTGIVVNGVLTFETNKFGEYGVVITRERPNAVVDYENGVMTGLEAGEKYKICFEEECVILTADAEGEITLEGADYDLYGKAIEITKLGIGQDAQSLEVGLRIGLTYHAIPYRGLYDGQPHAGVVTLEDETWWVAGDETAKVYYLVGEEYVENPAEFVEPGAYVTHFKVVREGYVPVEGDIATEIVQWAVTNTTDATTNFGGAELSSEDYKAAFPLEADDEEELLDEPEVIVYLTVEDVTNTVTLDEMMAVGQELKSSEEVLAYFDVNLYRKVGTLAAEKVHQTSAPVKVLLEPERMVDEFTELLESGVYTVIRLHDGVAERVATTVEDGKVSFETDRFSIYVLTRPVVSQEIDMPMPELDPLGVFAEVVPVAVVPMAETTVSEELPEKLDVSAPDTGETSKDWTMVVMSYLPAIVVAALGAWAIRKKI